jgi:flagellin
MGSVINTNTLSLLTQNNLSKSQSAMETAIQRLSSGMRINSAKDDAAGQAIANRFSASIRGLTQAQRNANDGISLAQTTEGALNEVNNNLQRIRELTVQAANGSNSAEDKASIQAEITQRLDEINRTSEQTDFNGVKVLAAGVAGLSIQVGSADNQTVNIDLQAINKTTLGLDNFQVQDKAVLSTITNAPGPTVALNAVTNTGTTTLVVAADTDGPGTDTSAGVFVSSASSTGYVVKGTTSGTYTEAAVNNVTGAVAWDSTTASITLTAGEIAAGAITTVASGVTSDGVYATETAGSYVVKGSNGTYYDATINQTTGAVGFVSSAGATALTPVTTAAVTTATLLGPSLSGGAADSYLEIMANGVGTGTYVGKTTALGVDTYTEATIASDGTVTDGPEKTITLSDPTANPLAALDKALAKVDALRGDLGAVQNRFDSIISNLGTTVNNLTSSRSRIEDADYATEVSNMTRAQILQQAGTSVLAKANQSTQGVMALLQ